MALISRYNTEKKPNGTQKEFFNLAELRHLAVNYAINCCNGYEGSFDVWLENVSPDWEEIAARSNTRAEEYKIKKEIGL